jgi:hypothetical protein
MLSSTDGTIAHLTFDPHALGEVLTKREEEDMIRKIYGNYSVGGAQSTLAETPFQLEAESVRSIVTTPDQNRSPEPIKPLVNPAGEFFVERD